MPHFNSMTVVGHLGRDPELKYTQGGTAIADTSVAVQWGYGERKDSEWFSVKVWGKSAENFSKWASKGNAVLLVGEFQIDKWTSKEGEEKTRLVLNVRDWTILERAPKKEGEKPPAARPDPEPQDPADDGIPF